MMQEDTVNTNSDGPGPDKPKIPEAPKGYAPLTSDQRTQWNSFLDYLQSQGLGGNPDLDKRDKSLGFDQLNAYKKLHPDFSISQQMIPYIQYEHQLLRRGDSFPTLSPEQFSVIRQHLQQSSPAYLTRPISDVDSWLGSLTSKQYYPTASIGASKGQSKDYGTDFETYSKTLLSFK